MTRARESLLATLAAIPDSARYLISRPGDTELPATVIENPAWLAEQVRLRGEIWGIDDRRTLATLWWYSASAWLVMPSALAFATDGTCLSPRLEHIVLHHQPDSRFSGAHAVADMGTGDPDAFAVALRATLSAAIGQLRPYLPRPRPLWAIAADSIAGRFLWAGQLAGRERAATLLAEQVIDSIGFPMPRPRYDAVRPGSGPSALRLRRSSCCLLYRVPGETRCGDCPSRPR
jgi:ferric iron reductase protein FhuF